MSLMETLGIYGPQERLVDRLCVLAARDAIFYRCDEQWLSTYVTEVWRQNTHLTAADRARIATAAIRAYVRSHKEVD